MPSMTVNKNYSNMNRTELTELLKEEEIVDHPDLLINLKFWKGYFEDLEDAEKVAKDVIAKIKLYHILKTIE